MAFFDIEFHPKDVGMFYNEDMVNSYIIVADIVGLFGCLVTTFSVFLIAYKTPSTMAKFKLYLLMYSISSFFVEFSFLLYKPVILPSYLIVYPRGFLRNTSLFVQKTMLVVMIMSVAGVLMSFLMMFIERFFALLNTSPLVPWYRQPSTYGYTLVICYFIIVSPWIASAYLFPAFLTVEENAAFVKQYIRGGEALFMGNQEFLVIRKDYFFIFIHATIVMAFIFGLFLLVFFSLYLNQYRKARRFLSPKAREIHSMLFRSMLFQLIALGSLVFSSFCLDILVFAFNLPDYYLLAPFMLAWSFPVIDNIVVIFTIRPYREFVLGLFCKKKIEPQPTSAPGTQMEMASPQTPN